MQEIYDALSFASAGPDGGLRVDILTPGYTWQVMAVPTKDKRLRVEMNAIKTPKGAKGIRPGDVIIDEVTSFACDCPECGESHTSAPNTPFGPAGVM